MPNTTNTITWQTALKQAVCSLDRLLELLALDANQLNISYQASQTFSMRVPQGFIARMEKGNPNDPLLRQVLPLTHELIPTPGYVQDPVGDTQASKVPGLLHKYHGRVLLMLTGGCAINCRYCFRRHFPYADYGVQAAGWAPALDYIRQDCTIEEVILSGGDPLLAQDALLAKLGKQLTTISHIRRLRIHTRLPVVLPERVTEALCTWLSGLPLETVIVIHCNHPQEIDSAVGEALRRLHAASVTLLNQSVLLKGVNDSSETLAALSKKLFQHHVMPYYLHLPDKTKGTAHFDVKEESAKKIMQALINSLPGYLVPKLVREKAGKRAKTLL